MTVTYPEVIFALCIIALPFIYETNHVFRYYLKFFIYYAVVMFNSLILIPVFALKPRDVRNLKTASDWCRIVSAIIGLRWIIRGKEYLGKDHACVIVANHQSSIDVLGMFELWPVMDKCTAIAKKELFYAWPFGLAAWLAGLVFIPRLKTDEAKTVMNEAAEKIKKNKTKLWVFPEGTRRNTGEIHPFKKGAFHLAITCQLPIQPVVFTRYYFLDKKLKQFDHGKIAVTALKPIETIGMTVDDIDVLMKQVRDVMATTFHETSKDVKNYMEKVSN